MRPPIDGRLLACQQISRPQDDRQLGELRWLQPEGPEDVDPVALSGHLDTDDEHGAEQAECDHEGGPGQAPPPGDGHAGGDEHEHDAGRREQALALGEGVGRAELADREHGRGAEHHEQAQEQQGKGRAEEQVVEHHRMARDAIHGDSLAVQEGRDRHIGARVAS